MKILIQGGGLCGLTTAALLEQDGHEVILVEQFENWNDPVGFIINTWSVAMNILEEIGIKENVMEHAYPVPFLQIASEDGTILSRNLWSSMLPPNEQLHTIERHYLHQALRERCKSIKTYLGTTSKEVIDHEKGVQVILENGTVEDVDLVIGCDGIHSAIRKYVTTEKEPGYYGWKQWLMWVPESVKIPNGSTQIWGKDGIFFTLPGKYRSAAWCTIPAPAKKDDPVEGRLKRLKERFGSMGWIAHDILEGIEDENDICFGDVSTVEMYTWQKGRVVLAGDAQHAPTPLMGIGASIAMEDGKVLRDLLREYGEENLEEALEHYESKRQKRVKQTQQISKTLWNLATLENPLLANTRNTVVPYIAPSVVKMSYTPILT